ncbi:MAG: hypothetical protein R6X20_16360 [Phycisphaerae bacterium]
MPSRRLFHVWLLAPVLLVCATCSTASVSTRWNWAGALRATRRTGSNVPAARHAVPPRHAGGPCVAGAEYEGYERREGAFQFTRTGDTMKFTAEASPESPLYNPVFVVRKWPGKDVKAKINLSGASSKDVRQGVVIDPDGSYNLIVWAELQATEAVTFTVGRQ